MIPAAFARALTKPHFWRRMYEPHAPAPGWYEELVPEPVELLRAGAHALRLRFLPPVGIDCAIEVQNAHALTELTVIAPIRDGMPHVLRWAELDQLARWAAVSADLPYPGWPTALLARAAPICDADGGDPLDVVTRAFATTAALHDAVQSALAQIDLRGAGFVWTSNATAWTISQPERYSSRTNTRLRSTRTAGGTFPHTALAELLVAIEAELAAWRTDRVRELARQGARGDRDALPILSDALQDAGCDRPALLAALRAGESWPVEMLLALTPGTLVGPAVAASGSASAVRWRNVFLSLPPCALGEALRLQTELARSGIELNTWSEDPPPADGSRALMPVYLRGDLEPALTALVAALRSARAPRDTVINIDLPSGRTIRL